MSIEAVLSRVSELQQALNPVVTQPTTTSLSGTGTTTGATTGSSDFSSVLSSQMASGVNGVAPTGGTAGQRMVALAQKEIGVHEEPMGSNDGPRIKEYRTATAGSGVGPWCAYFQSWLAKQAGAPLGEQGQGVGGVDALYAWAKRTGKAIDNTATTATPKAGDMVIFNEHIGLVESVDPNGTIHTIEGNSSDQVIRRTHGPREAIGYVNMN
ncbi:MAG: CHAP domain-containing protein [Solirubrobacteraceae bacterium]